ncbi:MAG: hypothetical protein KF795_08700 [Labilithrix sp.]|nr:hypothetical protein [Labilithrix sp.]
MTAAFLLGGCHCGRRPDGGLERRTTISHIDPSEPAPDEAGIPRQARGMWVWSTKGRLQDPHGTSSLLETVRMAGLTEVYLSVNESVLAAPGLPALVAALTARGVRVEALSGNASWYTPEKLPAVLGWIDAVAAFNAKHPAKFAGVHLDIEPHQLPENRNDHAFLPALAATLGAARQHAAAAGLTTSADLPRFALDEQHGPLFAAAVQRPFVMLYELRDTSPEALVARSRQVIEKTYAGASPALAGRLVVGLRVEDYPSTLETMLATLDRAHAATEPRFGGWAIHDEMRYRAGRR